MEGYKLISFDLDGTIVNTLPSLTRVGNLFLAELGIEPLKEADYKILVGKGAKQHVIDLLAYVNYGQYSPEWFQKSWERYVTLLKEGGSYAVLPYPGLVELFLRLQEAKIPYLVYTNKKELVAREVLKSAYKDTGVTFPYVIGDKPGQKLKPNPSALQNFLAEQHIKANSVLHVGDTNVDMNLAKNAGTVACGVLWGFRERAELEAAQADFIVANANELSQLIFEH